MEQAGRVVITMHQKPDADAMGSALGLYHFLQKLGHEVDVISPTNWAGWLNWMPGCKEVVDFEKQREKAVDILNSAEWVFCLDFNIFHRTKNFEKPLYDFKGIKVLIDHHREPDTESFDYGISNSEKARPVKWCMIL